MGTGFRSLWVLPLFLISHGVAVLQAQTPPPESTSKVKRVLLYNYASGYNCAGCREKAQEVFFHLAQSKGFSVDTTSTVAYLTLENLRQYQVIVWNNNTDGAATVREEAARNAVAAYVRQGGGWMLVNLANEHQISWPFLTSLIGKGTSGWQGRNVPAVLVADTAAQNHPELRFVVKAMPDSIPLLTNWLRVLSGIDALDHIKTIYRVKNAAWLAEQNGTFDDNYIWAGTHEQGKALALPLGWQSHLGDDSIMAQADSAVPRLYWQGLRWLAGDYQGGCTNPAMATFNPDARVDDGSCQATGIQAGGRHARAQVKVEGRRMRFTSPISAGSRMRLLDLRGHIVWRSTAPKSATTFELPSVVLPGLYFLETTGKNNPFQARILVP